MTSTQPHTRTGSSSVISGTPTVISVLEESLESYLDAVKEAVRSVEDEETVALRDQLSRHPDWADKSDSANVHANEGFLNYEVSHPDAMDLEYGNPMKKIVATGVLRSIAKRREYDVNQSLMRHLSSRLPDA